MEETQTYNQEEIRFHTHGAALSDIADEYTDALTRSVYKESLRTRVYIALCVLAVSVILTAIPFTNTAGEMLFGLAAVFLIATFARLFRDRKKLHENMKVSEKRFSDCDFYDDKGTVHTREGDIVLSYTDGKCIETDNLYLLYLEKSMMGVDKNDESLDNAAFRSFISGKTKLQRYDGKNMCGKNAVFSYIVLLAVFVLLGFGAHFLCEKQLDAPKVFSCGEDNEYHITLSKRFTRIDSEYDDIYHDGKNCYVSFGEIMELDGFTNVTLDELYETEKVAVQNTEGAHDFTLIGKNIDSVTYEYYMPAKDGVDMYCYVTLSMSDMAVYYTEFYCAAQKKDKCKPQFEEWTNTIAFINDYEL